MRVTEDGPAPPWVPDSTPADTVLERLVAAYASAADPVAARTMRAYMKDVAPFLGLKTPVRRALSRTVEAGLPALPRPTALRSPCAAGSCPSASTTTSPSTTCAATYGGAPRASCP